MKRVNMQLKDYDPKLFRVKRSVLGLTMGEIASSARISRQTVSNIELGKIGTGPSVILIGLVLDYYAQEKGEDYVKLFEQFEQSL